MPEKCMALARSVAVTKSHHLAMVIDARSPGSGVARQHTQVDHCAILPDERMHVGYPGIYAVPYHLAPFIDCASEALGPTRKRAQVDYCAVAPQDSVSSMSFGVSPPNDLTSLIDCRCRAIGSTRKCP